MSESPKLDDIPGEAVKRNLFTGFAVKETLTEYDFPLLLLAGQPKGENWLFKWCDTIQEPDYFQRWVAFRVSESRLASLKAGRLSLREAVTLPEEEFYVLDAERLFEAKRIKKTSPENLPVDYLPSDDVSVTGTLMGLQPQDENRLSVRLHVFSEYIKEGKAPLSIISPLQNSFQNYMTWAAHIIDRTPKGRVPASFMDWSTFNLISVAAGSFKMECVSSSNREQSERLSKVCELLAKLSNGDFKDMESIKEQIGEDGINLASMIAALVSEFGLSMSISWASSGQPNGYLAIDKRRADNFLSILTSLKQEQPRTITITLTKDEAEPIRRPAVGKGGMQSLLRRLQSKLTKENTIQLEPDEIRRILRYGMNYGQGGFQDRLVGLARALKRVGISFSTS